jgi:hypothetical protein
MTSGKLHSTSTIKRGTGERIFLAFAGRRHQVDRLVDSAKTDIRSELVGILLLAAFASMIAVVLWRHLSVGH